MDGDGLEVATDSARLDVDDLGSADRQGRLGCRQRGDRLVQAHRRLHQLGKARVPHQVVLWQRLLDEQQAELVELGEVLEVLASVRRVRVHLQRDVGPALAYLARRLDVPPRLDLQLDPAIAGLDVLLDLCEQRPHPVRDVVGRDPDRDSAVDLRACRPEVRRKRLALLAELGVEDRSLDRSLGHRVTTHWAHRIACRHRVAGPPDAREQMVSDQWQAGVDIFGGVQRRARGHALGPAVDASLGAGSDEQDVSVDLQRKRGTERADERQAYAQQLDGSEFHRGLIPRVRGRSGLRR